MFSDVVLSQWLPGDVGDVPAGEVVVSVDATLSTNRSVSQLRIEDQTGVLSLSPAWADRLTVTDGERLVGEEVAARIAAAGVRLNDPDHLFYLSLHDQAVVRDETRGAETRPLTSADVTLFDDFSHEAPEDDLDEAFVEIDHWLVFGTFVDERLVCAASMYPWSGTQLADLGVITLPAFRGRGLGRATVRAMSAEALGRGYEPQYRCQLENAASVALARAAGFTRFGEWEVIDVDE